MRALRWIGALALVAGLTVATPAGAQQPGQIYGKVVDATGLGMPGVAVTITSPAILTPQTVVTESTGTYLFPQLPIGTYAVKFELRGFSTVVREDVRIEIGFNAQINATMELSAVVETVVVKGESPMIDVKDNTKGARFDIDALQRLPSARDPWVIMEQTPSIALDRQNVGGNMSGQQSNFVARGAAFAQQKWNLDGVDITDLSATGGSPIYFDFDSFQEMQLSTGGADVTIQSPGVSVNLVTKAGSDRLTGSTRFLFTDESLQWNNVTQELRQQGASTGNPVQNIKDYGVEAGGPIAPGRAWVWGSYGKQDVRVGVNNFFKSTPDCLAMKANPLDYALKDVWSCLNADQTLLNNYNFKAAVQASKNNLFSFYFNGAEKVRNARDASDVRPIETTYRQMGVTRSDLGSSWWKTGMPKTYKWSDRHMFGNRFVLEGSYAHVGNNFALTFHEEGLRDVQAGYEITTGAWSRSYQEAVYVRPTDSIDVMANYFVPGVLGGDHSIKFGFKYRDDISHTESMWGGDAYARFRNGAPAEAQLYRRGQTEYKIMNRNLYLQDSYSRGRLTLNFGARFDFQTDEAHAATVDASPFYGQATFAGVFSGVTYTGEPFNQLPALSFAGAKPLGDKGLWFKTISPRVGVTYDLAHDGRSVLRFNYARYVDQIGNNAISLSSSYNTVGLIFVRYPWVDVNGDRFIQGNEIVLSRVPLSWSGSYDYLNPTRAQSAISNDPGIKAATTDEILVGFDKQIAQDFAVSASYLWRKYRNFAGTDRPNWSPDNWQAVSYTPTNCPAGARCDAITYYQPMSAIPSSGLVYKTIPDYWRGFQGVELSARKRMSKNWMMNAGFSYNNAPVHYDSPLAYIAQANEDPTNVQNLNGAQYAPQSTTSGIENVYVNAKWIFRASGVYTLPYQVDLAATYNSRQGYPFIQNILTPSRPNGAGTANVYLDQLGDNRLPKYQQVDLRVARTFTFGKVRMLPAMDVFNLFNVNTTLAQRATQNAANANTIGAIVAPRIVRFGLRVTF